MQKRDNKSNSKGELKELYEEMGRKGIHIVGEERQ